MSEGEFTRRLEHRVGQLEQQLRRVTDILARVAGDREALAHVMLDAHATEEQERAVYSLFDQISDDLQSGAAAMSSQDFARRIYDIFPARSGDPQFADSFLTAAAREDRWRDVCEYMRRAK